MPLSESLEKVIDEVISDVEGWKHCELVRARLRKHGGISREYLNTLLYLKRAREDKWLETYDALETWLAKSPRTFESLPVYPSWRHGEDALERRLGRWVYDERRYDRTSYAEPVVQAKYYLLCCLDGWSTWVHYASGWTERAAGVDMSHTRGHHQASCSSWVVKFEEADAWISQNNTRPRAKSSDPQESALGKFLERNRAARKKGKLHEGRASSLKSIDDGRSTWDRSFDATAAWFVQHTGRTPKQRAENADEVQAALFVMNQRARWKEKALSKVQRKKLAASPWWRSTAVKSSAKATRKAGTQPQKRAATKKPTPKMQRGRAEKYKGVVKVMKSARK